MKRFCYVCIDANPIWRVGQFFIVDEDKEYCVPARAVPSGPRGKFTLEAETQIELLFDETIKPYVAQVGEHTGKGENKNDSTIILA